MINLFRIKLFTSEQFIREQFSFFEEAKSGSLLDNWQKAFYSSNNIIANQLRVVQRIAGSCKGGQVSEILSRVGYIENIF